MPQNSVKSISSTAQSPSQIRAPIPTTTVFTLGKKLRIAFTDLRESIPFSEGKDKTILSVSLTDIGLDETAALAKMLEDHEIVDSVTVNTASFGGTYTTHMVITLVSEGEAGGEQ